MSKATLLVVDDTPSNLEVLREILGEAYTLRVALNGERALELAASDPAPDLILLDVMMPGMDGYDVCRRLKADARTARVPVIFVTAMHEIEDEMQGFAVGGVDYIMKPVTPGIVRARIATHLNLASQERHLARLVAERTREVEDTRLQIIQRLSRAAGYRDDEAGGHVVRMSHYARALGLASGLNPEEGELLYAAAPMYDIGKIGIPDAVLKKLEPLSEAERAVLRKHAVIGASIIGRHPHPLMEMARIVALTHHERWNGAGYPRGLKGDAIPLPGRVVAVCDVFDALISPKPWRAPWKVDDAVNYVKVESGQHFDPAVVKAFERLVPEFIEIHEVYPDLVPAGEAAQG